jgi:hypothetical protein
VKIRGYLFFFAGALAALGAGWLGLPRAIYQTHPQPVDFSHKVHAEKAGSACEDCHAFRDDGSYAGIPTLEKCAGCHAAPMGTTKAEKDFIDRYVTPNREPRWESYARQPENVWFSHATHVKTGKLKCEQCHGGQGSSDKLPALQRNRISGYSREVWESMKMDDCIDCHSSRGLAHSCLDCHK